MHVYLSLDDPASRLISKGYYLLGDNADPGVTQFSGWKIQGNFGGEDYPDKTRKIFNEGELIFMKKTTWNNLSLGQGVYSERLVVN